FSLLIALCVGQVGALFAADSWAHVTFTAGEVRNPRRNLPLALGLGVGGVVLLYLLANVGYLLTLPLEGIQNAPDDRVATAVLRAVLGDRGAAVMAVAIMISTFGCNNGLTLAGARVFYAMARDGLFFRSVGRLNRHRVPAVGLIVQGLWACLLVLPRTRRLDDAGRPLMDPAGRFEVYGNVYSDLLDYIISSVLIFYVLSIVAVFVLRRKRPDAHRPYRAFGYPLVPALYVATATLILLVLLLYKTRTTWPGLAIILTGLPVYFGWRRWGGAGVMR
ncbi:MAG: APC family permease, partial [Phycisphaerae bacterium]